MEAVFPEFGFSTMGSGAKEAKTVKSKLYTWGRNDKGQLGIGDSSKDTLSASTAVDGKLLQEKKVVGIGLGPFHTLMVTHSGDLFGSGDNSKGQLNPEEADDAFMEKPAEIRLSLPPSCRIVAVSCGLYHSACLTNDGHVITFGSNEYGQLGHSHDRDPNKVMPRMVEGLARQSIIQISCTDHSTLMLSRNGKVFSCGAGDKGVLGLNSLKNEADARAIGGALEGVPVCHIATGSNHCTATTVNGTVYAWGQGENGELGIGKEGLDEGFMKAPCKVHLDIQVRSTSCGEAHTIFVAVNGDVYSCGSNSSGQLGFESSSSVYEPQIVQGLGAASSKVVQAVCGSNHTVVLFANGAVYSFGDGKKGQLGTNAERSSEPTLVKMNTDVTGLSAAGESTFALSLSSQDSNAEAFRFRNLVSSYTGTQFGMSVAKLNEFLAAYGKLGAKSKETALVKLFNSLLNMHALNASFIRSDAHVPSTLFSAVKAGHVTKEVLQKTPTSTNRSGSLLDIEGLLRAQEKLRAVLEGSSEKIQRNFRLRIASVVANLDRAAPQVLDKDQLRAYFLLLISPIMSITPREHEALVMSIYRLPESSREVLFTWISTEDTKSYFVDYLVKPIMSHLDKHLKYNKWTGQTVTMCEILGRLHEMRDIGMDVVNPRVFYAQEPSSWPPRAVAGIYLAWKSAPEEARRTSPQFTLFRFSFLLSADMKRRLLSVEDAFQQHNVARQAAMTYQNPYFVLEIRRERAFFDTMETIEQVADNDPARLRRPLQVKFRGEDGLDAGGVRKEFFQMVSAELFARDLFKVVGNTNQLWFNRSAINDDQQRRYELVGVMMGLAVYNDTLLDVQFPMALYEMLLDRFPAKPTLKELESFDPEVAKQMQYVMDAETDEELEMMGLNFVVTEEVFGEMVTSELCPGGGEKEVTLANREEYVSSYIEYIILGPPGRRYQDSLIRGFRRLIMTNTPLLALFEPSELELILVGTPELNFEALEKRCRYEGGYDAKHKTVKRFWKIVHSLTYEQKQLLLKFATGSPRAPVGGLETMFFRVQRAGPDSAQLPTAHTCFNTLMLPDYSSEAKMRKLLLLALENAEGFGLE